MNYPDLNSILLSHNHKYSVSVVLKWIITHLFLCNYSQFDKHRKPKSTFFMDLNPAPFLTHQAAIEHDGFHPKKHLCKESFISGVEQELSWSVTRSFWQENAPELSRPWRNHGPSAAYFFAYYFAVGSGQREESYTYGCPSPVQSISVSEGKVMGLWGGGFGAKQTAKVSTLKANTTPCLNYTPWALQFSHTLTLSPRSPIPANTPFLLFSWPS